MSHTNDAWQVCRKSRAYRWQYVIVLVVLDDNAQYYKGKLASNSAFCLVSCVFAESLVACLCGIQEANLYRPVIIQLSYRESTMSFLALDSCSAAAASWQVRVNSKILLTYKKLRAQFIITTSNHFQMISSEIQPKNCTVLKEDC